MLLTAARAIAVKRNRLAWALIALGLTCWTVGDLCWTLWFNAMEVAPYPNVADAFYLGMYVLLYAALALLMRDRIRPFPAWLTIDGVLAGPDARRGRRRLGLRSRPRGDRGQPRRRRDHARLPRLRPAADRDGARVLRRDRVAPGRVLVAARRRHGGMCALADTFFIFMESTGAYEAGSWLDNLWPVAVAAIALAAWQRTARPTRAHVGWSMGMLPLFAGATAIVTLVHAALTHGSVLTVVLAAAALFTGIARAGADAARELHAAAQRAPRGPHRQADRAAEPARARPRPRGRLRVVSPVLARLLRPRRLQGLQRRLRPPGRRRAARPARARAGQGRRNRVPPRRRRVLPAASRARSTTATRSSSAPSTRSARTATASPSRRPTASSSSPTTRRTRPRRCGSPTSACTPASAAAAAPAARRRATCSSA